ncbi:thioesterase family protein [Novosphingobium sp. Gsoil 351]|uniref:acyl-CoA thioesterase n=1 Tax=Novosphingobium sp. Gsoil 351 TaxID=2675225 RepID=UPI0012B48054|nr:acyl-CoA thioesterase [Novosphingobium sp. Gsoil 351]QGN54992.1 acyl-CoA thioesterase [Novosphingobium sp. Gsoil 351]
MSDRHAMTFTAGPAHIDELGHVNNTVWVQWIQEIATAHWHAVAAPAHVAAHVWVVTRHEIDYRGNIGLGESVIAETFIPGPPRGAQFDRCVVFRDRVGKTIVSARSTWALLDRASGRLCRVRPEIAASF